MGTRARVLMATRARGRASFRRRRPHIPLRTVLLILATVSAFTVAGERLVPAGLFVLVLVAGALWYAPEVAYWADDLFALHRLPGFGEDHRHLSAMTFVYLLAAMLAGVYLGANVRSHLNPSGAPASATTTTPTPSASAVDPSAPSTDSILTALAVPAPGQELPPLRRVFVRP